jgi:hypothetical protein
MKRMSAVRMVPLLREKSSSKLGGKKEGSLSKKGRPHQTI